MSLLGALQKWGTRRPLLATVGLILPVQLMGEQVGRGGEGWAGDTGGAELLHLGSGTTQSTA